MVGVKKVLMVVTVPFDSYGIGTVVKNYVKELHNSVSFDFLLCSGGDPENIQFIKSINGRIVNLHCSRLRNPLTYTNKLRIFLKSHRYDVIHVNGNSGTMFFEIHAAKMAGVTVRIAHCHNSDCRYKILHYLLKSRLNHELTDGIACSQKAGEWLFSRKFTILNNAIQTEKYKFDSNLRNELRKKYGYEDKTVLLNVGRLTNQKNQRFIIDLLPDLISLNPRIRLCIVGDGELEEELQEYAKTLGVTEYVTFAGKQENAQFFYSMADIFLFPSIFEGLGLVLIEAQAAGLPSVASEAVPRETRLTNTVRYLELNKSVWLNAVSSIKCLDSESRIKASMLAREQIKEKGYDIGENAKQLLNFYI